MNSVIEYQDVAVRQRSWRMLARDRRRAKFPHDVSGLAGDANNSGGRPEAGEDIAVRQLLATDAPMPHRPRRLDLGNAICNGVKMLPSAPLPNSLPCSSHLSQVRRVHLAGFSLQSGKVLVRSHLGLLHPSFDMLGDFVGYLAHTIQQHVSIAQQNSVVMMVRMAYFPEHLAGPVRFQGHTAFERKATKAVVLWRASVEVQRSAFSQIARQARRIRHIPGVDYLALKVDQIHRSTLHEERGK